MNSKRVGGVLIVLSVLLLFVFTSTFKDLTSESEELGCFGQDECKPVERSLSFLHIGFGLFGFILALGFYLIFLSKGNDALVQTLERRSSEISKEDKFSILLMGLDEFEKSVISEVRKQDGITQSTLRLRVDMSKAKLSQILSQLEKKNLIKRVAQKKTLAIHIAVDF